MKLRSIANPFGVDLLLSSHPDAESEGGCGSGGNSGSGGNCSGVSNSGSGGNCTGGGGGSNYNINLRVLQLASGLCIDVHPYDSSIYLIGTDEGHVHRCSTAYNEQYVETYTGHSGPVYQVRKNRQNNRYSGSVYQQVRKPNIPVSTSKSKKKQTFRTSISTSKRKQTFRTSISTSKRKQTFRLSKTSKRKTDIQAQ